MVGITITASAAARIRRLWLDAGGCFRVGVAGGGCNGLTYTFAFVAAPESDDWVTVADGVTVCLDHKSLVYLSGAVLDCVKTFLGESFEWRNPQQGSSCSCGASFSLILDHK